VEDCDDRLLLEELLDELLLDRLPDVPLVLEEDELLDLDELLDDELEEELIPGSPSCGALTSEFPLWTGPRLFPSR
jgi:hypothetical protein